jgi:hypothetical protein
MVPEHRIAKKAVSGMVFGMGCFGRELTVMKARALWRCMPPLVRDCSSFDRH